MSLVYCLKSEWRDSFGVVAIMCQAENRNLQNYAKAPPFPLPISWQGISNSHLLYSPQIGKRFQIKSSNGHPSNPVPLQNGLSGNSPPKGPTDHKLKDGRHSSSVSKQSEATISITIVGASGDLAKKKILPALFALFYENCLPKHFTIFGYARSKLTDEELRNVISETLTCRIDKRPDVSELELKLSEHSKKLTNLQQMVQDLSSKYAYNPNEDYAETESRLRASLESFLETVRSFNLIYTKEIRPWTHMMEVPQLHGFGPAANRLLEAYDTLLKFLGNLRSLRDSYAAMAGGTELIADEPSSSVSKIIVECESALTFLNHNLGILSASVARQRGEGL